MGEVKHLIELIAGLIMFFGLVGTFYIRISLKKGIGLRAIQFMAIIFLVPVILILALEKILTSETIAALLGAVSGYTLSGIGQDETAKKQ